MKVVLPILVVAFETDYGGVVSNTRYLEYIERGRYAMLQAANLGVEGTWAELGVQAVVRRVEVDYVSVARHEDKLELEISVREHTGATSLLAFELTRPKDGAIIMRARQTLAYINTKWRPVRVPDVFLSGLPAD